MFECAVSELVTSSTCSRIFAVFFICASFGFLADLAHAQNRAAARSFMRAERAIGSTDRLGGNRPGAGVRAATRSRKATSSAIGGARTGSVSSGFNASTNSGRFDEPTALNLKSWGSTGKKSHTFRGLRNKQASCVEQPPTDQRFSGKKRLVNTHCDPPRRR